MAGVIRLISIVSPCYDEQVLLDLFFLGSVQMLSLGIIGEYVGSVHTIVQKWPLVVEKERVNFDVVLAQKESQVPVGDWIHRERSIPVH